MPNGYLVEPHTDHQRKGDIGEEGEGGSVHSWNGCYTSKMIERG